VLKRTVKDSQKSGYKIYSSATEFIEVEAETASEAALKSGVEKPIKIEKTGLKLKYILRDDELESENISFAQKEAQFVTLDDFETVAMPASQAPEKPTDAAMHANDYNHQNPENKQPDDKLDIEA
jgi:hypothetical protein